MFNLKISNILVDTNSSITNTSNFEVLIDGEIDITQKNKNSVDELMKNIMISGTNKIDPIKYQAVETLINKYGIHSPAFEALLSLSFSLCKFYFLHSNKSYLKSPQSISNWFKARGQSFNGIVHFFAAFRSAKNIIF
jgi:hypothetical protein